MFRVISWVRLTKVFQKRRVTNFQESGRRNLCAYFQNIKREQSKLVVKKTVFRTCWEFRYIAGTNTDSKRFRNLDTLPLTLRCRNFEEPLSSQSYSVWLSTKMSDAEQDDYRKKNVLIERTEQQEVQAFDQLFQEIVAELTEEQKELELQEVFRWFKQVLEYNVLGGKRNRGLAVVMSYKLLAKPEELTAENIKLAQILGWCVEMLQAFFLVSDDIMDQSITRRGKLCWYKRTSKKTAQGQCLDMLSTPPGTRPDFSCFTQDRYNAIVKYKTAFYSFCLPVQLAMHLAGWTDPHFHKQAETILLKMGHFFQVQDDYLDCYGDPAVIGKQGTDIEDGKCSWLIISALAHATIEQRQILQENYALSDSACIQKVKIIYKELGLSDLYHSYEEKSYQELTSLINELTNSSELPAAIFHGFMKKIYGRKK
ncbi:farnesyl pyrophosphate synthase isoform X2 [Tachypleus tridentatus]|uniref:farnesyl pyrophosphate synthase isoform X2 n=1 Tax=Tachypleus tridentatus TaxID=6853 RepID=UPI003FCF1594